MDLHEKNVKVTCFYPELKKKKKKKKDFLKSVSIFFRKKRIFDIFVKSVIPQIAEYNLLF